MRLGGRASGESARISAGESARGVAGCALRPSGVPGLLAPRLLGLAPGHLALLGGPVSGLLGGLLRGGLLRGAPLVPVALLGVVLEGLLGVVAVSLVLGHERFPGWKGEVFAKSIRQRPRRQRLRRR